MNLLIQRGQTKMKQKSMDILRKRRDPGMEMAGGKHSVPVLPEITLQHLSLCPGQREQPSCQALWGSWPRLGGVSCRVGTASGDPQQVCVGTACVLENCMGRKGTHTAGTPTSHTGVVCKQDSPTLRREKGYLQPMCSAREEV